ncbi:class I SAM-dependent methyltransferase [Cysteiniphilum sp. JM-1]|uniref:class I SAM-dependent methyltransferase n=1 Tax=Cysteiniphilum sp. JM-1 TaxID=2610891 RepID=UPI001243A885|nr:class I SAM-dependent methyltransferase [Cysteiniphilum sp. JM-1]
MQQVDNKAFLDPDIQNWDELDLPKSWVDELNFKSPIAWLTLIKAVFYPKNRSVRLDEKLLQEMPVPKYVLQEFHNIPCGNYSKLLTRGYIKGFDVAMLNQVDPIRKKIAHYLKDCHAVLDIGCGGGKTSNAIYQQGAHDIWGIDPSPYLLKHAALDYPHIKFIQGVAESLPFTNERFDGLSACYVLHEIPPRYITQLIAEASRVLKKGGVFVIAEPSPLQYQDKTWQLCKDHGIKGVYFKLLARKLNEPFVKAFHQLDLHELFIEAGFDILEDKKEMPHRFICVRKR